MTLDDVLQRVRSCMHNCNRNIEELEIIAVSKKQSISRIMPVLQAGHRLFGESRVDEASDKWNKIRDQFSGIRLEMVGHLQTNKVSEAFRIFDSIHTLDRVSLARKLADEVSKTGYCPRLFIQIKTGSEFHKSGIIPYHVEEFLKYCREVCCLPIVGFMTIPPLRDQPLQHFQLIARLSKYFGLPCLSMGMSNDFHTALAAGATSIRIGTAIFSSSET